MSKIWYKNYEELSTSAKERRNEFLTRCKILGVDSRIVLNDIWDELITRAVKESNWQEGLKLNEPRTQQMATEALYVKKFDSIRIDINNILKTHRKHVKKMIQEGKSEEEIGAFNLSSAHYTIPLIGSELENRLGFAMLKLLDEINEKINNRKINLPVDFALELKKFMKDIEPIKKDTHTPYLSPLNINFDTEGDYIKEMLKQNLDELMKPMTIDYIHFLHKLTLCGLYPVKFVGRIRKEPVHISNKDVIFPSHTLLPGLMKEFCKDFPPLMHNITKYDPILKAAKISYKFVSIHPYLDGNGRLSRLLMNLILWAHKYPPIYIKADKKGRHKYSIALKKANHGDIKPLACLISISIEEIYQKLLNTVKR